MTDVTDPKESDIRQTEHEKPDQTPKEPPSAPGSWRHRRNRLLAQKLQEAMDERPAKLPPPGTKP